MTKTTIRKPRDTENKIELAKKFIADGLSQQEVAKKVGVSGWTVSQWKIKGKLGALPKGRIPKNQVAKAITPNTTTTKPVAAKAAKTTIASSATADALQAEIAALKDTLYELKALIPPATLAAYKQARAAALAALD